MKCQKCGEIPTEQYPFEANIKNKDNPYLQLVYFDMCEYNQEYEDILDFMDFENNFDAESFSDRLIEAERRYGVEKVDKVMLYDQLMSTTGDIKLVCRYCAGWDDNYG